MVDKEDLEGYYLHNPEERVNEVKELNTGVKSIGFIEKKLYITFFYEEFYIDDYLIPYHEDTICYDLSNLSNEELEQMKEDLISK